MSINNRFTNRGNIKGEGFGLPGRVVLDNRKPIYLVLILDTSASMSETSQITLEDGSTTNISKIQQLNDGMKRIIKTLKNIESSSPLFKIYLQIIHLDSYGAALFPQFMPVSSGFEQIKFEAEGCTCLGASLNTLKTYICNKYLKGERDEDKGYNKAVSVILMSDGQPTDGNGYNQDEQTYKRIIDEFMAYLTQMDYARNVDMFSIAVGDDACEEMLKYFADSEDNFYRVDQCESIASKLDFVTRQSMAQHTTPVVVFDGQLNWDISDAKIDEDIRNAYNVEDDDKDDDKDDDEDDDGFVDEDDLDDDDDNIDKDDEIEDDFNKDNEPNKEFQNDSKPTQFEIDSVKCKKDRCLACVSKCPVGAIVVRSGVVVVDTDNCNGCGICKNICPLDAVYQSEPDDLLDDLFNTID